MQLSNSWNLNQFDSVRTLILLTSGNNGICLMSVSIVSITVTVVYGDGV